MIISMKKGAPEQEVSKLIHSFEDMGLSVTMISGDNYNVFGLVGDTTLVDEAQIAVNPYVDTITRVSAPYKKVNRLFHPEDSVIDCGGVKIGGQEKIAVIAGPCSVEGLDPLLEDACAVKAAGATMLRGGAYKPRTSPYAFQGLGTEGIMDLVEARKETGLPIVSELMAIEHLDEFIENVDLIQVGARNMQNFDLLKALGHTNKPVLLKRGIRTFEKYTRNTLDLSVVPIVKEKTHLPIIIDPSHATGDWRLVESMSLAAVAAGVDGLIIEVHPHPEAAWSDGAQSLTPEHFAKMVKKARRIAAVIDREL